MARFSTRKRMTAAHRTLPMPSIVRVTNLENGKSVLVRVNDRGPFAKGRIIDVSERAAELLGYYKQGTARVRVTYVGRGDINGAPPPETPTCDRLRGSRRADGQGGHRRAEHRAGCAGRAAGAGGRAAGCLPSLPARRRRRWNRPARCRRFRFRPSRISMCRPGAFSSYDNANRLRKRLAAAGNLTISSIERAGHRPLSRPHGAV